MSKLKDIVKAYNLLVKGIEQKANEEENRAYGGVIRAGKGLLVENITKHLLEIAWDELGGKKERISFNKTTKKLPILKEYVENIEDKEVKKHILNNIEDYYYTLKADVHCNIDDELVLAVECKAYTENAMIKRILVDFTLMKHGWENLNCFLLQLESQLGGDYSDLDKKTIYGSSSTHTLFSYFDVKIDIITLLEGERNVNKAIHNPKYYKELKEEHLKKAIDKFKKVLKNYL
ncbi:MAG TPA: hypothetical protein VLB74_05635 [Flavobacterium sp.]|uniref:hypothetical protein n=1 Tax=Flavobacterium sp. TaxID=239 RepID=UPI002BB8C0F7|nr:hypothetical protein [Flavobacterium sp.]HSD14108.1 hypothetical protein [Flavobacterium sp.]